MKKFLFSCLIVMMAFNAAAQIKISALPTFSGDISSSYFPMVSGSTTYKVLGSYLTAATKWSLTGNSGLNAATNFLGTTDAIDVVFKRNNTEAFRITHRQVDVKNLYLGGVVTDYNDTTAIIYKYHPGFGQKFPFIYNYRLSGTDGENLFMGLLAGNQAMSGSGIQASYNTGMGPSVLHVNSSGFRNAAFGTYVLSANTTGFNNDGFGHQALASNITGFNLSAFGTRALGSNTTGTSSSAFGTDALAFNNGFFNAGFCIDALYQNTTGSYNSAFGDSTFWIHTIGIKNTAIGSRAGYYLGDLYPNFATVKDSMITLLGADASRDSSIANTTALTNMTVIGYNAKGLASNQVVLGNNAVTTTLLKGRIGIGTNTPAASALLELNSTTQGLLLPRMTKAQRDAISSPATGLAIFQTDNTPGLRVWNGTNWMRYTETAD